MASVDDRWYVQRKMPDGTTKKERTARHGSGKRWLVRWRDHGSVPRKKSFDRKVDADREAAKIETELARGTYIDPKAGTISFREYAEQWRTTQFADPNTAHQVGVRFRLHVYPSFGHRSMQAITPTHIRQWVHDLTMARSYQRTIFANVSQVFTAAAADDIIGKNPCRSGVVRKPVADPREIVPWSASRVAGVSASLPDRYSILAPLAAGAGLRQGEVFGLSPEDVDFRRGTINIRRQVKLTAGNQPYLALPKGRKTRIVPMPETVRGSLSSYLERFPARTVTLPWDRPDGDPVAVSLVVTTRESKPVNRHYFNAKIWKPALIEDGIPPIRDNGCHALRHYYASVLLDGGESIKTVSERLGHSDPASHYGPTPTCCPTAKAAPRTSSTPRSETSRHRPRSNHRLAGHSRSAVLGTVHRVPRSGPTHLAGSDHSPDAVARASAPEPPRPSRHARQIVVPGG